MNESNIPVKMEPEQVPVFKKQIRGNTYVVKVHFSESAKETLDEKIKRMLRNEVELNVNNF